MKRLALLAVVMAMTTACLGSDFASTPDGSWELESGQFEFNPIPMVASHPITIVFDGDQLNGTAACNGYGGRWQLSDDDEFEIADLAWTEMACAPPEVMDSEAAFLSALMSVDRFDISNGKLVLTGTSSKLTFKKLESVPTAELLGTVWVLDGLIEGESVSTVAGERATLELFTDGSFIGSTGCRTISGAYVISGSEVVFTTLTADGECPTELADQDSKVISALEGGFRVDINGDRMTTWNSGDEGLAYQGDS
jgi:heat shock protein HslJ